MCHVFHKCQWYCCRCCALPYDLRNSSVFSARLNASSDDSDVIMILTLVLIFSVKFPENVVRFCRGHDAAKYVFFIVELFVDKILQHAILWDRPFPIKHFCPSFGVCRKNSVP